jgi:hypothetical protein
MAKTLQLQCLYCGTAFLAGNTSAKWCSVSCRKRAFRRRHSPIQARRDQEIIYSDSSYALDPQLPLQWQDHPAPGHDCRTWQGTAIQRRQSDGYVNATAMCQANGRLFADYARLARTQEYLTALAAAVTPVAGNPITGSSLIRTIQGGTPSLQGTWIHPRLAVDLARWISPAFAVWMDGWFLESLQRPAQPALATGIHVVAPSRREAFRMWNQTLATEFVACMSDVLPIGHNQPTPLLIHTHPHTD